MVGSDLYRRVTDWNSGNGDAEALALHHKAWDPTPWMCDAYTGSPAEDRSRSMRIWCRERFGKESWPLHDKPARWYFGGATVYGWTWVGFDTKEAMDEFMGAWPAPAGAQKPE